MCTSLTKTSLRAAQVTPCGVNLRKKQSKLGCATERKLADDVIKLLLLYHVCRCHQSVSSTKRLRLSGTRGSVQGSSVSVTSDQWPLHVPTRLSPFMLLTGRRDAVLVEGSPSVSPLSPGNVGRHWGDGVVGRHWGDGVVG